MYFGCILGVSCWDPNFGPIELYFTGKMGFFGVGSSFMTFITIIEYVFSPYPVYPVGILGVFWVYPVGIPFLVQLSSTLW